MTLRLPFCELMCAFLRETASGYLRKIAPRPGARRSAPRPDGSVAFTAIDVEDVAVDERSCVRRDEDDRVGKLLREAEATHRNRGRKSRLILRRAGKAGQHAGVRGAGGHGIHANPRL